MFDAVLKHAKTLARSATHVARQALSRLRELWASGWHRHRDLVQSNHGYRSTLIAAAVSVVTQLDWRRLVSAVVVGALALYAAAHHVQGPWLDDRDRYRDTRIVPEWSDYS